MSELLDYLERGFTGPDHSRPVREEVLTRHPLQPFSPRYFQGDGRLFSYAADLCEASRAAAGERGGRLRFLGAPLPEPPAEWRDVTVEQLIRFFSQPTRYLVRERLGIKLEEDAGLLETREPFALDSLSGYELRRALLDGRLRGAPREDLHAAARAGGLLPHGQVGQVLLGLEASRVERFARQVEARRPPERREAIPVDLDLGPIHVRGRLADLGGPGRFAYRFTKTKVKDRIGLWIHHLLLNHLGPPGIAPESLWLGEEGAIHLTPVTDAEEALRRLADLYWAGLSRVLHLFPESSYAYAARVHKDQDPGAGLRDARKAWEENEFTGRGEETDPYHRLAFRGADPLDEEFTALAESVFLPLLGRQEEA